VTDALPLASFKLQFAERRARIVPTSDASGCPFAGPGVDLIGDEAAAAFALAVPFWRGSKRASQSAYARCLSISACVGSSSPSKPSLEDERPHVLPCELHGSHGRAS